MPTWRPNSKHSAGPITDREKSLLNDPIGMRFVEGERAKFREAFGIQHTTQKEQAELRSQKHAKDGEQRIKEALALRNLALLPEIADLLSSEESEMITKELRTWDVEVIGNLRAWTKDPSHASRYSKALTKTTALWRIILRKLRRYMERRAAADWGITPDTLETDVEVMRTYLDVLWGRRPFEDLGPAIDALAERLSEPAVQK